MKPKNGLGKNKKDFNVAISYVASYLGVHPRTLRIWDKQGLLVPKRKKNKRRCYTLKDIELGQVVYRLLVKSGLNISGAKMMLSMLEMERSFSKNKYEALLLIEENAKITKEVQERNIANNLKRGRRNKPKDDKKD